MRRLPRVGIRPVAGLRPIATLSAPRLSAARPPPR
jgi:hypothetical protein